MPFQTSTTQLLMITDHYTHHNTHTSTHQQQRVDKQPHQQGQRQGSKWASKKKKNSTYYWLYQDYLRWQPSLTTIPTSMKLTIINTELRLPHHQPLHHHMHTPREGLSRAQGRKGSSRWDSSCNMAWSLKSTFFIYLIFWFTYEHIYRTTIYNCSKLPPTSENYKIREK